MSNLDFIRGVLEGIGDTTIDLSDCATEGDFIIFLDKDHHVHRYMSCAAEEDVDLDDPGMYMDPEDDESMIMYALQTELIYMYNKINNYV